MNLAKIVNNTDMSQEEVCFVLKEMDILIHTMLTLTMQSSNIVENTLTQMSIDYLLDKRTRSSLYHGNLYKFSLPLIKLTEVKNIDMMHKIIDRIELTRDTAMHIIDRFLKKTTDYEDLIEELAETSNTFHEKGTNAKKYNILLNKILIVENNIGGNRNYLYGAIKNIKSIQKKYYDLRNSIILAYLKLNLSVTCKLTTKVKDSFQNGVLGIIKAIDKSRVTQLKTKIYSFVNFVKYHIKNGIASAEFNTRTDLVFNVHPQILKQTSSVEELHKMKGEKLIDEIAESLYYTPNYILKENSKKPILTDKEYTIVALLNGNPSDCKFDKYPTEKEIKKEKNRQINIHKKSKNVK